MKGWPCNGDAAPELLLYPRKGWPPLCRPPAYPLSRSMSGPFPINFLHFGWIDAADVLLVTVLLYQLYKLLRGSVALNVALGAGVVLPALPGSEGHRHGAANQDSGTIHERGRAGQHHLVSAGNPAVFTERGQGHGPGAGAWLELGPPRRGRAAGCGPLRGSRQKPLQQVHGGPHLLQSRPPTSRPLPNPATGSMPKSASACCSPSSTKPRPCTMGPLLLPTAASRRPAASCR